MLLGIDLDLVEFLVHFFRLGLSSILLIILDLVELILRIFYHINAYEVMIVRKCYEHWLYLWLLGFFIL